MSKMTIQLWVLNSESALFDALIRVCNVAEEEKIVHLLKLQNKFI